MKQFKNYSLLHNNTFGIDQKCDELIIFETVDDAVVLVREMLGQDTQMFPILILGGGSNLLLTKDFHGKVLTAAKKFEVEVLPSAGDEETILLRCWAGTTFDDVVAYAVEHGYYGIENLSLIPGECGASAVQNIGAYGVEIKDVIDTIEAVQLSTGEMVTISADECGYGYRRSRFKQEWKDKYLITHVTYRLSRRFTPHLEYGNIRKVMEENDMTEKDLTAQGLRDIIINIRRAKLPDPSELGNAGSFFMNPIVDKDTLNGLKERYPDVRYFEVEDPTSMHSTHVSKDKCTTKYYKIPAGWMIDRCGWKGRRLGNVGVYEKQALVLVNYGGATGNDVVALMHRIQEDVYSKFRIHIYPEVNIK
ncbi:MAG: UDP-N-acetylmuramate dehydrogenase [Prevotella sp.]